LQVKKWAKVCNVNDASNATMSSYSIIIMLLHYLQTTTPPVLPFLQDVRARF
jgi:terminal uridylyltransferase